MILFTEHGAVIALYFKKPGHFPMVVERKAKSMGIYHINKIYNSGIITCAQRFLAEQIPKVMEMDFNLIDDEETFVFNGLYEAITLLPP